MKLRAKDLEKDDVLSGRIERDPTGGQGPWVTLDDGTRLGSLLDVLDRFSVEEASSDEGIALAELFRSRDLAGMARHLDEFVRDAENAIWRLLSECERFREHASQFGFRVTPPTPGIPGSWWSPSIQATRWNGFDPEHRSSILRALLIGIDWQSKMQVWDHDAVAVKVVDSKGEVLDQIQLREGYRGPVA